MSEKFDFRKVEDQERFDRLPSEEKQQLVEEAHEEALLLNKEFREKEVQEAIIEIVKKHDLASLEGRIALGEALWNYRRTPEVRVNFPKDLELLCDYYRELGRKLELISRYEAIDYSQGITSQEHFGGLRDLNQEVYGHCNADAYNFLIPTLYPERYNGYYWKLKKTGEVEKDQGRNQVCLDYLHEAIKTFANTMATKINGGIFSPILFNMNGYYPQGFSGEKKYVPELIDILEILNHWNETRKVWADLAFKLLEGWADHKLPQFDFNESEEKFIRQLCDDLVAINEKIVQDAANPNQTISEALRIFEVKEVKDLFKKHSDIFRQILTFYNDIIDGMSGKISKKN